ncbi:MAG: tRNA dihydrouridine synthase DusB [Microthrixaceae bacterium]|nr:tRNA dihydrouridine synthase DusB [Microthrixaceae bacterium]
MTAPVAAAPARTVASAAVGSSAAALTLGRHRIWPPVVLAPMAGVTDTPYRVVCSRRAAPLCVNEMVTARAIVERHAPTLAMLDHHPSEPLRSLQLYGTDPHYLGEAVRYLVDSRPLDHLDLNFGCPAPKVTRLGGGAALPYKRPLFARMIRSAVAAADGIPVTVKFRMGIDDDHLTFLDTGRIAQDEGAAWVALHARTAEQLYAPSARWEAIGRLVAALDVPVLGNGDIFEADDAVRMMSETGCAGVVIGRGCLGKPWLFSQLRAVFDGEAAPPAPTLGEVRATALEHAREAVAWRAEHEALPPRRSRAAARRSRVPQSAENRAVTAFRKHLSWYLKGYPTGGEARRAASRVTTLADVEALLDTLDPTAELIPGNERLVRSHSGGPRRVALPDGWLADPDDDPRLDPAAEAVTSGG